MFPFQAKCAVVFTQSLIRVSCHIYGIHTQIVDIPENSLNYTPGTKGDNPYSIFRRSQHRASKRKNGKQGEPVPRHAPIW